jgi:hypothetical protein
VLLLRIHGVKILGFLFWGLLRQMKRGFKSCFKEMLGMLKDKKSAMIKALIETLCAGYFIIGPKEMYEEIRVYNKQRNKDIRINLLVMIEKLISFSFQDGNIREFFIDYIGLFASYAEDKDISVKRKLMNLLKATALRGRKDLGTSLVEWMETQIRTQVKGSQKMIDSLGEYSPQSKAPSHSPSPGVGVTSLHQIEIESPKKVKPIRKPRGLSPKVNEAPKRRSTPTSAPQKEVSLEDSIQNLKKGSLRTCESALNRITELVSTVSKKNPIFELKEADFFDLLSGLRSLLMNPTNSDEMNFKILEILTILFEKLNSSQNDLKKRNIKGCLSELWKKSRVESVLVREKVFGLITRLGTTSFYFGGLVNSSVSLITGQKLKSFNGKWNSKVINIFSCFDWFMESDVQGASLIFPLN